MPVRLSAAAAAALTERIGYGRRWMMQMEASTKWLCSTSSPRAKLPTESRPAGILERSSRVDAVVKDVQTRAYKERRRAVMLRMFLTLVGWEMLTEDRLSKLRLRHGSSRAPRLAQFSLPFRSHFFFARATHLPVF